MAEHNKISNEGGGGGGEVVINVSGEASKVSSKQSNEIASTKSMKEFPIDKSHSPEASKLVGSSTMPPRVMGPNNEGLTRRRYVKSVYSQPKSRLVEPSCPVDFLSLEEEDKYQLGSIGSLYNKSTTTVGSTTPVTPPSKAVEKDEDEEIYIKVKMSKEKRGRITTLALIELAFFVVVLSALVASLTIGALKNHGLWGLEFWKWCVLVMVIFSGMLVTNWFVRLVVFLIETSFLLRRKVLYFVHGLRRSVQVFIWLSLILVTWILLFDHDVHRSRALNIITRSLISLVTGSFLWMVKTLLLKILAANFNVNNFFQKIQESVFHQYVLQTLLGPPLIENALNAGHEPTTGQVSLRSVGEKGTVKEKKINMGKVHRMKREKVSALTMRVLVEAVRTSRLSTISDKLDATTYNDGTEHDDDIGDITTEMKARAAAFRAFRNVAQYPYDHINEGDLLRFMIKEEVDLVLPLFAGAETGKITKKAFTDWVVEVYKSRKALAHSLNDTKTAVKELNRLVSGILIVITLVIWLLLLEIATTKVLLFLSTQLVALAFIIGSTCKNLFESIVFVFVMHPYDVGDFCVIDGVTLQVEEMNLLTTVFLKLNFEKVYYPNVVLATKPISNYYRSPEMGESVEFSIAFSTDVTKIDDLKARISEYLEKKPQHWAPTYLLVVNEMENMNELKMALYTTHTISYQDIAQRFLRRTELSYAVKGMLEDLKIDYTLLPQQVVLTKS